jgi:hypothetical protein
MEGITESINAKQSEVIAESVLPPCIPSDQMGKINQAITRFDCDLSGMK